MSSSPNSTDGNTPNHEKRMSQVRRSQNICYPESIEAAQHHILSRIATSSDGFDVRIPSAFYFTVQFQEFLSLAQDRNQILRYGYFPNDHRLQIVPMGSPVHSALVCALEHTLRRFQSSGSASNDFFDKHIRLDMGWKVMGSSSASLTASKKLPARNKSPDLALAYVSPRSKYRRFTVVLEVGFSETHDDLVNDAYQWLKDHRSEVNLVMIIDVKENRSVLQNDSSSQERIRQLVVRFGNEQGRSLHGIDNSHREVSDKTGDGNDDRSSILSDTETDDLLDDLEETIHVDDWVGPLTANLQFWELSDGTLQQRGQSLDILPKPKKPVPILIPIVDMIPQNQRRRFTKEILADKVELSMDEARKELTRGRWELALSRARNQLRPKPQNEDSDYLP